MNYPLPLYNGALWLDNSTIDNWLECPREYEYEVLLKRRNIFGRPAMNYGKCIHQACAALVAKHGSTYTNADLPALDRVIDDYFEVHPQPADDHRQSGLAKETMHRYVRTYEIEPWTVLETNDRPLLERVLWCPLTHWHSFPVNYFALIDLAVRKPDGIWIKDIKTTSMLGSTFDFDMQVSNQMRGYLWMFHECFDEWPVGYIIDAIRTLSPPATAQKTPQALDAWWAQQFRRLPFYTDKDSVEEWHETLLFNLNELFAQHAAGFFPPNRKSCVGKYGRCQFYDVCTLPRHQRAISLASNNFEDNTWIETTLGGKIG